MVQKVYGYVMGHELSVYAAIAGNPSRSARTKQMIRQKWLANSPASTSVMMRPSAERWQSSARLARVSIRPFGGGGFGAEAEPNRLESCPNGAARSACSRADIRFRGKSTQRAVEHVHVSR